MTRKELVKRMRKDLYDRAFGDIWRASIEGEAKMAGFILGACFIDAMAGFMYGINKKTCKTGTGCRFKAFVSEYLQEYDADKLYNDLRNYLVHSYTEGGSYAFTHAEQDGKHFEQWNNKQILNLENFFMDLCKAYHQLENKILNDPEAFRLAEDRYKSMGLMSYYPK